MSGTAPQGSPAGGAGRKAAVEVTSKYEPGTVGHVVHHAVKPFACAFGDFGSGSIGQHYRESDEYLKKPATEPNLREFAERETGYWKQQPGVPGLIGGSFPACGRTTVLIHTKKCLDKGSS